VEENARRKAAEREAMEEYEKRLGIALYLPLLLTRYHSHGLLRHWIICVWCREAERIKKDREEMEAEYQAELEKKRIEVEVA